MNNIEYLKLFVVMLEWNLSCSIMAGNIRAYNETVKLYKEFSQLLISAIEQTN